MATLYENFTDAPDGQRFIALAWAGQTFTPSTTHIITIVKIKLYLRNAGETPGTVTVGIRTTSAGLPTGNDLASGTTDGDTLTDDSGGEWREIELGAGTVLTATNKYAIAVRLTVPNANNKVAWKRVGAGGYAGGNTVTSGDGSTWFTDSSDHLFEAWGEAGSNLPVVYTQECTNTIARSSTGWGVINSMGGSAVTQHGHCWNTSTNPTTSDSWVENGVASNIGQFSSAITGLTPGTLYYVRAYATNSGGTAYGQNVTITTGSTTERRFIWTEGADFHYFDAYGAERVLQGHPVASDKDILPWLDPFS